MGLVPNNLDAFRIILLSFTRKIHVEPDTLFKQESWILFSFEDEIPSW